jgi:hypothetical protein
MKGLALTVALLLVGCSSPFRSPSPTLPSSISTQPIDAPLDPQPTPLFPQSDAIGVGTFRLTMPRVDLARFWLTCEWSTTRRVQWLYSGGGSAGYPGGPITLFGETVWLYISNLLDGEGDAHSLDFSRQGDVAPYRIDPAETPILVHAPDWTSGSVTFEHFRLDPDARSPDPVPTPKDSYERPLGGDPTAVDLSGSFEWTCGPRPDAVPTADPSAT